MVAFASILYYVSAAVHALTVPKHIVVGLNKIAPATSTILDDYALQKKLIVPTWLHSTTWLLTTSM